jgi:glycosyltransferase involved in cell wall biosynthesis
MDGMLATPDSKDEFVARLRTLLDDPKGAAQLAEFAFQKVTREFSAERMTRQVEALYTRYLP